MSDASSSGFIQTLIGLGGLFVGSISMAVRGTYMLNRVKEEILDKMMKETNDIRQQAILDHEDTLKRFGDSLSSQSEKIRQGELWGRDNYVRRQEFDRFIDSIGIRMEAGFSRLEAKLESKLSRD